MSIHFEKLTIIGVGLIGGSFARVCKKNGIAKSIVGFSRCEANLLKALKLGVIDKYYLDLNKAVEQADFVLIAVPVGSILPLAREISPFLKKDSIISDVGSVKGTLVEEIEKILPNGVHFVGAHPIAGTEKSGVEHSFVELFEGSKCIITPTKLTDHETLHKVKKLWEIMGSEVQLMESDKHDKIMAAVSHLPHIAAYSLTSFIFELRQEWPDILSFSAGGFRDFTRIASSNSTMWSDICRYNRKALLKMIEQYETTLNQFKTLIEEQNWPVLEKTMDEAKKLRDSFYATVDRGQGD